MIKVQIMDRATNFLQETVEVQSLREFRTYWRNQCNTREFWWRVWPDAETLHLPQFWNATAWDDDGTPTKFEKYEGDINAPHVVRQSGRGPAGFVIARKINFLRGPSGRLRVFKSARAAAIEAENVRGWDDRQFNRGYL